ncbi:heterokaryon incompatibility protein-domain-containing protein [Clohesyomyces aquaticus]|uniref:Heterokaryon incompatibility protein-domain-containing protein n=1 Tax=Clohesyomyces aquaticus TaxID=1231657 RepID=A0A1Y2A1L1_9PLEO|nr:heterokaryon incompatibility protein-domain-containing protein [Clohesyomyces aquaticus]
MADGTTEELNSEEITWTLRVVQFHNLPEKEPFDFDALSYTWGNQKHTFPFICNSQLLQVHHNLHAALPYLARRRSRLPIWIDAICTNQQDEAEKMVQIRQMHQIYRRAHTVWIWLGPPVEGTAAAIQMLLDFTASAKRVDMRKRVYQVANNPWFDRLWVIQEAALARRPQFLIGLHEIEWTVMKCFEHEKGLLT